MTVVSFGNMCRTTKRAICTVLETNTFKELNTGFLDWKPFHNLNDIHNLTPSFCLICYIYYITQQVVCQVKKLVIPIVFGDHTRIVKFVDVDFLIGADGTQLLAMQGNDAAKFFFYQLSTQEIPNTGYNRHFKFLKDLTFEIPPLDEQRAIAEVLSDVDRLIGALDALIAKKQAIKQAAMQQLLTGRTRLPGFSGEWETKRLGEVVSIRNQKVIPSNVHPDIPCVELDQIASGNGRLLECSTAQHSTSSKYRFIAGDVLFGRLRSYLRKFWHADREGICTTEIWPLMVDPGSNR